MARACPLLQRERMRLAPLALALAACAHPAPTGPERPGAGGGPQPRSDAPLASADAPPRRRAAEPDSRGISIRQRIVAAARRHLGRAWRGDCSDFVERVHAEAGVPLKVLAARSASEGLWRAARPVERPRPGDLAFFHDTFDRDGDGRRGDRFTHVALVESISGPRAVLIHRGSRGIRRLTMNLSRRHDPAENGWLRKRRPGDPAGLRLLSGELFAAYATAIPAGSAGR